MVIHWGKLAHCVTMAWANSNLCWRQEFLQTCKVRCIISLSVGDAVSSDMLQSGAAYLFQLFANKTRVTAAETLELRKMFGYHSTDDSHRVFELVHR